MPLLDAVFAEEALAGGVGFQQELYRVELAYCHQGYVVDRTLRAMAGCGDLGSDLEEVFGYGRHEAEVSIGARRW